MPSQVIKTKTRPIKAWIQGVPVEAEALQQLKNIASLPFIYRHVAAMPDVHLGKGATVGSVIPTQKAIIPAAVGVDIGCGMVALKTSLKAKDLPENLKSIRLAVEEAVPHGRTHHGRPGDKGAWTRLPKKVLEHWSVLEKDFKLILASHPKIGSHNSVHHLGSLGTGNHFIELCLDQDQSLWIMLHSGSRGVGNRIGTYFTQLAKKEMGRFLANLPDQDLAYFKEGTKYFKDYVQAVGWAQDFAAYNRKIMLENVIEILRVSPDLPDFQLLEEAINCHHNYVTSERHFGQKVWITRKGAVRAGLGELGIIPGSMGTKSYIVRGKGNDQSFHSCSHGAGRKMSRTKAKKTFSLADHAKATEGVECRKDAEVLDETPEAYKDIDQVMAAQSDLVEVLYTLKQVLCVKGLSLFVSYFNS
ncbi:MAG: RtcB family protein [Deltaproteobacteria bacterium]|nr:RtcB family protein [Deltaproteobacteria bacterium]